MDAVYSGYNLSTCSITGSHRPSCLEAPQLHQAHGMCHETQKHVETPAVPLPGSPISGHGHAAPQHAPEASCRGSALPMGGPVSSFYCFAPENTDRMEHSCQDDNCFQPVTFFMNATVWEGNIFDLLSFPPPPPICHKMIIINWHLYNTSANQPKIFKITSPISVLLFLKQGCWSQRSWHASLQVP